MKCMCPQTRPRFILSSERVLGEMEFEPMLTPREKSPLPENFPRGGSNPRRCGQLAQTLPTSYSGPRDIGSESCISLWQLWKFSLQLRPSDTFCMLMGRLPTKKQLSVYPSVPPPSPPLPPLLSVCLSC